MQKDLRLAAIDLDGTLLRSDGKPCPDGLAALQKVSKQGIKIVISTVRRYVSSGESLYAALGFPDPLICSDGAEIYSSFGGELWRVAGISREIARGILELSVGYPGVNYWKKRNENDMAPPASALSSATHSR